MTVSKKIRESVKTCHICQMANQPTTTRSNGLSLVPTEVDRSFKMIGLDLEGPLSERANGFKYIIIAVDYFTGWTEVGLAKSTDAQEVWEFIHQEINCRHGTPAVIVMDSDAARDDVKAKCHGWGIKTKLIQAYAPYMNRLAEALVKQYKKGLRKLIQQHGSQWEKYLWDLVYLQRIVVKTATRISAFELLYGRRPVLRAERLLAARYEYDPTGENVQGDQVASPVKPALDELWAHQRLSSLLRITQ
jgi:hypothetical protein